MRKPYWTIIVELSGVTVGYEKLDLTTTESFYELVTRLLDVNSKHGLIVKNKDTVRLVTKGSEIIQDNRYTVTEDTEAQYREEYLFNNICNAAYNSDGIPVFKDERYARFCSCGPNCEETLFECK